MHATPASNVCFELLIHDSWIVGLFDQEKLIYTQRHRRVPLTSAETITTNSTSESFTIGLTFTTTTDLPKKHNSLPLINSTTQGFSSPSLTRSSDRPSYQCVFLTNQGSPTWRHSYRNLRAFEETWPIHESSLTGEMSLANALLLSGRIRSI